MSAQKSAGMIAVFKSEGEIINAAKQAREKMGYKNFDAFTPYPVHGLDDAMNLKRSWLPYVTFIAGLTGAVTGLGFQIWTSAVDWPINIGGKPMISLSAFIPVTFELTVLFAGLATVGALFHVCRIPNPNPRILHERITNDRFVLFVPSTEKDYDENSVKSFMSGLHPEEVKLVPL